MADITQLAIIASPVDTNNLDLKIINYTVMFGTNIVFKTSYENTDITHGFNLAAFFAVRFLNQVNLIHVAKMNQGPGTPYLPILMRTRGQDQFSDEWEDVAIRYDLRPDNVSFITVAGTPISPREQLQDN